MRLSWREIAFLILLISMPVSAYWFVFRPRNQAITQARAEIGQKELMLGKLAEATARSRDLQSTNTDIAQAIGKVESRLPGTKEVDVILEQVASLARESRLELPRFKSGNPIPYAKYMEQPLEVSISGDFNDFYQFLLSLERLERVTRMTDLSVKKADDVDGTMQASFTLSIYFQPDTGGHS